MAPTELQPNGAFDLGTERPLELPRPTVVVLQPFEVQAHGSAQVVQKHAAACLPSQGQPCDTLVLGTLAARCRNAPQNGKRLRRLSALRPDLGERRLQDVVRHRPELPRVDLGRLCRLLGRPHPEDVPDVVSERAVDERL